MKKTNETGNLGYNEFMERVDEILSKKILGNKSFGDEGELFANDEHEKALLTILAAKEKAKKEWIETYACRAIMKEFPDCLEKEDEWLNSVCFLIMKGFAEGLECGRREMVEEFASNLGLDEEEV